MSDPSDTSDTSATSATSATSDTSDPSDMVDDMLEEGLDVRLDFDKVVTIGRAGHRVVPVVLQDAESDAVLFVGYTDAQAYRETLTRGTVVLYSTSRSELWYKGSGSGDVLEVVEAAVNCEQNSLLYRVRRTGAGACHTTDASGSTRPTCYYRVVVNPESLRFT